MTKTENIAFETFKAEIINRAKKVGACMSEISRAVNADDFCKLMQVIKDNFCYACNSKIIDAELIESIKEQAAACSVYVNVNVTEGYLLASGSATVSASGSAIVRATDSAIIKATDSATVSASDSATVRATDSATVEAFGSATVIAFGSTTVEAFGSATVRASGSATVEAYGSSFINVRSNMSCKISDNAIMFYRDINQVVIVKGNLTVKEV
jgi:hypothetical protein